MKSGIKWLMLIIILIVIAAGVYIVMKKNHTPLPQQVSIDTSKQPLLGNPDAKVHIVAFEDLKCHNCMRFNVELFPAIQKKYIDTGKAKYTMINLAFIPGSMPAANAARCVYAQNPKLFYPYVEAIYSNQPPEDENWATISNLVNFARNISGINPKTLSECIYKSPYTPLINNNLKIAMKAMNGQVATPAVYVNGYLVRPLTLKRFDQVFKAAQ